MLDLLRKKGWFQVDATLSSSKSHAQPFQLEENFDTFQLRALALQAKRVLVPVLAVSAVIAYLLPKSNFELSGWVLWLLVAALMMLRWRYSQHYLEVPPAKLQVARCARMMLSINFAIGSATGAFCWLGFPSGGALQHAAITTLMVGLAAGAVATCSSSLRSFLAYALPLSLQLIAAWIVYGEVRASPSAEGLEPQLGAGLHLVFAATIAALFWVLLATCHDTEQWIRKAFGANLVNQNLVAQLKNVNLELSQQREAALAANQAKTRFLAAASHDLRQPLHALSLYSASLSLQILPPRAMQLADAIQSCIGKSLAPLLDALLDVSKLDANLIVPAMETFSLGASLGAARQETQARCDAKGLALHWEIPETCVVYADPRLLGQIVRNLLDNALKYTEQGSISFRVSERAHKVSLEIADTGVGIDADDLPRVFEEFYQCGNAERDRSKGLGLGLAIVKRLSDLMKLDLTVESCRHNGTLFCLSLPYARGHSAQVSAPRFEAVALARVGMQILVIDNEMMVRDSTRGLLEEWGCQVSVATNAREALELALERQFDVLLSDYRLKASENGLEVLTALAKMQPRAHCWLVTGETGPLPWPQLQEHKIKVLHKPLVPDLFLRELSAL